MAAFLLLSFFLIFCIFGFSSQLFTESTWFTSSFSYLFNQHNFHVVQEGELYRSGQLSEEELKEVIKKYNIKSIVDLRSGGDEPDENGFSEKAVSTDLGAKYNWVPMVGSNTKQKESLTKLIDISSKSEGPTLIHCTSGTHRSGLASAVWLISKDGMDPEVAATQLSQEYGYFKWERDLKSLFLGHETADYVLWHYIADHKKSGISFSDWLKQKSDPL